MSQYLLIVFLVLVVVLSGNFSTVALVSQTPREMKLNFLSPAPAIVASFSVASCEDYSISTTLHAETHHPTGGAEKLKVCQSDAELSCMAMTIQTIKDEKTTCEQFCSAQKCNSFFSFTQSGCKPEGGPVYDLGTKGSITCKSANTLTMTCDCVKKEKKVVAVKAEPTVELSAQPPYWNS